MKFQNEKTVVKTETWLIERLNNSSWTILTMIVLALNIGPSGGAEDECGGPLSDAPFPCIQSAIKYFNRCTFPVNKLSPDCILSSCPRLTGLNPVTKEGCVNRTALNGIVTVLNECLAATPTICGINVARLPMVRVGWTMDQVLPAFLSINGSCTLNSNAGSINHLNQAVFSLPAERSSNGSSVTVTFTAPNITQTTTWNCSMSISTLLIKPLREVCVELFNFPETKGLINITIQPTLSIDLTASEPSFRVVYDNSSINVLMYNFVSCRLNLPQILVDLMNLSINRFFKQSETSVYATNFLSTMATQAIYAAGKSC